jgi:hypothetical protein
VASYFCTPEGRVLHVVAGPVDAATLLKEARWVVETWKMADLQGLKTFRQRQMLMRKAHGERLVKDYNIPAKQVFLAPLQASDGNGPLGPFSQNGWNGWPSQDQQAKVHQVLAAYPLVRIGRVYPVVFQRILDEKISLTPVLTSN